MNSFICESILGKKSIFFPGESNTRRLFLTKNLNPFDLRVNLSYEEVNFIDTFLFLSYNRKHYSRTAMKSLCLIDNSNNAPV